MRISLRPFKGPSLLPAATFALMGVLAFSLLLLFFVFVFGEGLSDWFIRALFVIGPMVAFLVMIVIHIETRGLVRWPDVIDIPFGRILGRRPDKRFKWVADSDRNE